jgi:hypothetical protein
MMMRLVCPECSTGLEISRAYAHRMVLCENCGEEFMARPTSPLARRHRDDEPRYRTRRRRESDMSIWAIASFLFGIFSSILFCIPPLGLMAAVAGLVFGSRGLGSRSRNLAVVGLVFSMVGMTYSAGVGITIVVAMIDASNE